MFSDFSFEFLPKSYVESLTLLLKQYLDLKTGQILFLISIQLIL